ncbi:MAG: transposase [Oscillospiraceae bacterium]|nr:transposase [Oscillospiraceae bacterium]
MYLNCRVKIPPEADRKITVKTINGTPYVYYEHGRVYHKDKRYNIPNRTCIGKKDPEQPGYLWPNEKFLKFFPRELLPNEKDGQYRSGCVRIGAYIVIRKIVSDYHLDEMIARIIGRDAGLFIDLAAYSIITEDNAGQYYPDYAYNHALFTEDMKIYSDSKVSDFLHEVIVDQRILFLNEWNRKRDHRERIYISYDSTNKVSQAGDIELVELGHAKDGIETDIFNYAIAFDRTNREPLFYESYPRSIVDISQLQYTLKKAKGYGYEHVGFILDRGYFCKENIAFMDESGYAFVIMVKGMKSLVSDLVLQAQGTFENDRKCSIRSYKVSGTTVKQKLFADDKKERYFHIYYDDGKKAAERENLETKIDLMAKKLKEIMGEQIHPAGDYKKYFDLFFWHEGQEDEKFMSGVERTEIINKEIGLCGYFVIVTSEKMTAAEALELYKSRDDSEKTFRGDKSYLGAKSERVYSNESYETKIFIGFVATIIRNRIYTLLKEEVRRIEKKQNYMTVPAALKELEKIELIKGGDGEYIQDHAVTATQKAILKAFGMTAENVGKQAREIASDLARIRRESAESTAEADALGGL